MPDTPAPRVMRSVDDVYGDTFDDQEVEAALNESLSPRSLNELLFDLVAETGLPPGSAVLDVGAREGRYSFELSRRFGFTVRGVEPVRRHLDNAARDLAAFAVEEPEAAARVRIDEGVAEKLTDPSGSVDLIWCRDVLVHVEDLETAFGEFRRVLKPGGRALVFQMTATDWLTPAEAAFLWPPAGIHTSSVDPQRIEAAITGAGLSIEQCIELHGETRERSEEDGIASSSQQLLWVSRLLRNRAAYEERFGTIAYEYLLTDSLWGVYQMIGKLNPRIYVLSV
ncbi:Methyltransferase domain-containing protein [Asanoa ishikariensis]|uniref:Methyltransferase domain-containing protein n=1 Tax=Asanoa ishikariensis TaxID=137265 RepID=A0A1H3UJG4_9ACTN|nr:class I SAM-dependent methyltransferase [Asanoa ishikariensis]SDZ62467.1 Methyltransferase domain-containing protein [Asanoa ishikariensis]